MSVRPEFGKSLAVQASVAKLAATATSRLSPIQKSGATDLLILPRYPPINDAHVGQDHVSRRPRSSRPPTLHFGPVFGKLTAGCRGLTCTEPLMIALKV